MSEKKLYAAFLDLQDRPVLLVGGGSVAARKARVLLEAGADLTVVCPEAGEEMAELEQALEDLHGGRAQAELHDSSAESGSGHEPGEQHSGGAPREDGDEIPFPAASRSTQKDYSWAEDGKLNLLV